MMPWIVWTIITLIFNMVQIIGNLVAPYGNYYLVFSGLAGFLVGFYIFIVVWSHRFLYSIKSGSFLSICRLWQFIAPHISIAHTTN